MIACDNPDCPAEWFHLGCVGLTNANRPRGKWYERRPPTLEVYTTDDELLYRFCPECRFYEGPEDVEGDYRRMSANPPRKRTQRHPHTILSPCAMTNSTECFAGAGGFAAGAGARRAGAASGVYRVPLYFRVSVVALSFTVLLLCRRRQEAGRNQKQRDPSACGLRCGWWIRAINAASHGRRS